MIGYKAFDQNLCCRGFQFEIGKTYRKDTKKEDLKCYTDKVFHFCRELHSVWNYYDVKNSRLCEVIAGDFVRDNDKYGTNEITILREIKGDELEELLNSGNRNSGNRNSGDYNSGNCNSGDCNSGNRNSGNWNSGDYNSGNWNLGNCNSGDCNSGDWNSGDCNSGDCNSGNWNSGNWNSGNWNSGNWNSGNCNSGNWNSGNWNSGYFNFDIPKVRIFGKETDLERDNINFPRWLYFDLTLWVSHDTATEKEKKEHEEEIKTSGGFLKTLDYKEAFKRAYSKTSDDEKISLFNLPNFDAAIFEKISGIDVAEDYKRLM